MSVRTPKEAVEAYNYELWNKQNFELSSEILADTVIRHYPGMVKTMTREESVQRIKDSFAKAFPKAKFTLHKLLVDGEYVTLLWEMQAKNMQGEEHVQSNIEVFRVVDGKICEVWNPPPVSQHNGLWLDLEAD